MKKIAFLVEPSSQLYNLEKQNIFLVDSDLIVYYKNNIQEQIKTSSVKDNFSKILETSEKILTSIPPVGQVYELIEKLVQEYDLVIGLPLSKYLSNAYSVWKGLEKEFNDKFYVLDVDEIEIGVKWTIDYINNQRNKFKNIDELQKLLNKRKPNIINYIVLTNVEKLVASGRVSKLKAKVVDLLKFKLILELSNKEHKLTLCKKVLSLKSAVQFFIDEIKHSPKYKTKKSVKQIAILSSYKDLSIINEMVYELNEQFDLPITVTQISPIVAAHTGINAFGLYAEVE